AQQNMDRFRPYAEKFEEVLGSLAEKSGEEASPLLVPKEEVEKVHIVLCTSDRGLCGGFNMNLITKAAELHEEKAGENLEISFTNFGKKGRDWCRNKKMDRISEHLGIVGATFGFNVASTAASSLVEGFLSGSYDEVYVVYSEFVSMAKQVPIAKQILPITSVESSEPKDKGDEDAPYLAEHICEPPAAELLGILLPKNVSVQLFSALLETSTSEHAARMMAMDNATNACSDMIDELTLAYNKARQAAITAELMDIVGGAEALKG
ncbi:MAG: ATP synthase F1 subunit gamma, partial [Desulfobacteraceae bacterium]|nr:ATP synthase F1 subunit gamma [Desulfobacteraceae bacterium]